MKNENRRLRPTPFVFCKLRINDKVRSYRGKELTGNAKFFWQFTALRIYYTTIFITIIKNKNKTVDIFISRWD